MSRTDSVRRGAQSRRSLALDRMLRSKLTWALTAEVLILLACALIRRDFFHIEYMESTGMLFGPLIDILSNSSDITIIAMGMTLVIALGGTDLSVGALMAVSGAIALKFLRWDVLIYNTPGDYTVQPFFLVLLVPLVVCTAMGLFNGVLIAKFKMQPIIATLVLMVAGRGIAQIITDGKQFTTGYTPFRFIGQGSLLALPMPVIITAVIVAGVMLFTRKTSFGLFVESVGVNPNASRVSGLKADTIILIVFALTGFLSGVSGLIYSGRIYSCDSNNAGIGAELDAIMAVVIGGTSMSGGKFSLTGTVIGSLIVNTIGTLLLFFGTVAEAIMFYKAIIIAVVIIIQSEPMRRLFVKAGRGRKLAAGGEARA